MLVENSSVVAAAVAVTGPACKEKVKNPLNNLGASHRSTLFVRKKSKIRSIIWGLHTGAPYFYTSDMISILLVKIHAHMGPMCPCPCPKGSKDSLGPHVGMYFHKKYGNHIRCIKSRRGILHFLKPIFRKHTFSKSTRPPS